jgi:hypothetical protein
MFDHPDAYLRRMLINEHVSWRRRLANAVRRDILNDSRGVDQGRPFDQEWVDRVELIAEIRKLAPRQRAVIVLRHLDDYTIAETAFTLGCTESTVRAGRCVDAEPASQVATGSHCCHCRTHTCRGRRDRDAAPDARIET